jgi:hypothetical protein
MNIISAVEFETQAGELYYVLLVHGTDENPFGNYMIEIF